MDAIDQFFARKNLASIMDKVCGDHSPMIITRRHGQSVVVLSLADYEALEETAYLLQSPANAKRLMAACESLDGRKV